MDSLFSTYYDNVVMLAAVVSLLLVILFVLFLHIYAKLFLSTRSSAPLHRRRRLNTSTTYYLYTPKGGESEGLNPDLIKSIPSFTYTTTTTADDDDESKHDSSKKQEEGRMSDECAICLGVFEEGDIGRKLPRCAHDFHLECIDRWLSSRSNCPICRYPVLAAREDDEYLAGNNDDDPTVKEREEEQSPPSSYDDDITRETTPTTVRRNIDYDQSEETNNNNLPIEIVVEIPNDLSKKSISDSSSVTDLSSILPSSSSTTVTTTRAASSSSFSGLSSIISRPLMMISGAGNNRRIASRSDQFRVHPSSTTILSGSTTTDSTVSDVQLQQRGSHE